MKIEDVAKICHETNRAYCETLGDKSQVTWGDCPEWQRESAINGVKFHLENPNAGPAGSHANWLKEKLAAGWKYGPVKNVDAKEHPCCVPYSELPEDQRRKDSLFVGIVHACSDTEQVYGEWSSNP